MFQSSSFILEPMQEEEVAFIKRKVEKDKSLFLRTMRNISIIGFMIPTIVAVIFMLHDQNVENKVNQEIIEPFTWVSYLVTLSSLFLLLFLGAYWGYIKNIKPLIKDGRHKLKVVERTKVLRKQYIKVNNSFYFHLNSAVRMSIEVNETDFRYYTEGDEINIEYSRYAKEYFGYF